MALLLWCRRRRARSRLWRRSGSRRRRGARVLHRIALVEESDNVLRHVDLIRGVDNRSLLRRVVQDDGIAVILGVLVQDMDQLSADAVNEVMLRVICVF